MNHERLISAESAAGGLRTSGLRAPTSPVSGCFFILSVFERPMG